MLTKTTTYLLCTIMLLMAGSAVGQQVMPGENDIPIKVGNTEYYLHCERKICKGFNGYWRIVITDTATLVMEPINPVIDTPIPRTKLLQVHGNVSYEYVYRSATDTSLLGEPVKQHTERVWLDVLYKEKYPLRISFTARQNNSSLFKDFNDANLQFDRRRFFNNKKQDVLKRLERKMNEESRLEEISKKISDLEKLLDTRKAERIETDSIQIAIEKREAELNAKKTNKTKAAIPAEAFEKPGQFKFSKEEIIEPVQDKSKQLADLKKWEDSLRTAIRSAKAEKEKTLNELHQQKSALHKQISEAKNQADLNKVLHNEGVSDSSVSKVDKFLSGIQSASIGRSIVNYSELTVQNLTVVGLNVEYERNQYMAFSVGKVDYRFRDFLRQRNRDITGQHLILGRFGTASDKKMRVIFTLFDGKKNENEFFVGNAVSNSIRVTGYSLETIVKKNDQSSIGFEVAKSTRLRSIVNGVTKEGQGLFDFNDIDNLAVSVKGQHALNGGKTKLQGSFRRSGKDYQSFSFFNYGANQVAWNLKADQSLIKDKLRLVLGLRQNDFSNIVANREYHSTAVFKSVQLNVRVPKYPYISIGYYPATQLYVVDENKLTENVYYVLNGTATYNYSFKGLRMNSTMLVNHYSNKARDTASFIYRGSNYYVSQSVFLNKWQFQGGYSYSGMPEISYRTMELFADVKLRNWLKAGAGMKDNKVMGGSRYRGGMAQVLLTSKILGGLQFQYEKSYLPRMNKTLYPVESGRITWYKTF